MKMDFEDENDLPAQVDGPPRTRRGGNTVPVLPLSSSNDGQTVGSTASLAAELDIASTGDLAERSAVTSGVPEISDEEDVPGPSTKKRKLRSATVSRAARGDRAKRGRPPTTGEWVNLSKAKAEYVALKEREMELDEIESILDPSKLPKWTKAKQNLPTVGELRGELVDSTPSKIRKGTAPLFVFLEKLSDKSSGISGRIVHELRVNIRKLEAAIAELSDRTMQDRRDLVRQGSARGYLRKSVERLEGELREARSQIESLRVSSSSFSIHSPPRKKPRGSIRDVGTQVEVGEVSSLDSINVPLPDSPAEIRKYTVDRGCSPVWKVEDLVPPSVSGGFREPGAGVSLSGNRDLTALEQSLLDHIETLFAQRDSIQEDIGRIRKGLESPRRSSLPLAVVSGSKVLTEKRRKKRKNRGTGRGLVPVAPPSCSGL
ncbi:gag-like protein [Lasius niger]|uniref:Gag-like protein n=1 Tax=Lasius niger TaxID=67767 RepID=A0A0J7KLD5_LASNI|nr:gag-like protein [Lasius niger]